jgi:NADPH:quinone reductase-like Zn-dependent oxidoreductase
MKAVRFSEHGAADRLRYEEVADPVAGAGEVVVRVKSCALNYLDLWQRKGLPGVQIPLPHISGSDVAGIIESVGPGVEHLKPGEKTLLNPGLSCMHCEQCYQGNDNQCREYSVLGNYSDGGYAERVKIPAVNALPYPGDMPFFEAAALPLVFMTAWHMLVTRCGLRAGEDVLVLGAGSGVGSAAIQIAKLFHARVIATVGSEAKIEKALLLGADHVINHAQQKIRDEVRALTQKRGVDIVFEHVGTATWQDSMSCLTRHGRLVTCGVTTGYDVRLDLRHVFAKELTIMGSYMGAKHELLQVMKHVQVGLLHPVVAEVLPLKDAARAQDKLENREHFGKIVLVTD